MKAREYEVLQRGQVLVHVVELRFETIDKLRRDGLMSRNAKLAAQFEQVVLHVGEAVTN